MNATALLIALSSAVANALATLALRQAAIGQPLFAGVPLPFLARTISDWYLLALLCYGLAFVLYALALQRLAAGIAYPVIVGSAYLLITAAGAVLFAEHPTPLQWVGGMLITAGIALICLTPAERPLTPAPLPQGERGKSLFTSHQWESREGRKERL